MRKVSPKVINALPSLASGGCKLEGELSYTGDLENGVARSGATEVARFRLSAEGGVTEFSPGDDEEEVPLE